MGIIKVNKVDAACRQINAAIRMLFNGGDPTAIHTLAAAGGKILQDLCKSKAGAPFDEKIMARIVPGKEKEFWKVMNLPANFLKHADLDPGETLEFDEKANDTLMLLSVLRYKCLGYTKSPEMCILLIVCSALYPKLIQEEDTEFQKQISELGLYKKTRAEVLKYGREWLVNNQTKA